MQDTLIEFNQAIEMSGIYSNILSGTMDAVASIINNNLNAVMKVAHVGHYFDDHSYHGVQLLRYERVRATDSGLRFPTLISVVTAIVALIIPHEIQNVQMILQRVEIPAYFHLLYIML